MKDLKRNSHGCVYMWVNKLGLTLREAKISKGLRLKMRRGRFENVMLAAKEIQKNVS